MKGIFVTLIAVSMLLFLGSCYSYGPTHAPYEGSVKKKPTSYVQQYMTKTFAEVKKEIPEAVVELVKDSIIILFPDHIVYKAQEVEPSEVYQSPLNSLSKLLQHYKETDLLITGHCDNTGTLSFNKKLSLRRANFIKDYLVGTGLAKSRIETWGLGSSDPLADNETPEGRKKNRRVEFVVLYADGSRK